jgi:hypothetical protein
MRKMLFNKLVFFIFCIYNVKSQSTFGTLSTASTTITQTTTKATFGPLSTASTTITQTTTLATFGPLSTASTVVPISECPINLNFCKNGAGCLFINGREIICTCTVGFTGLWFWIF